MNKVKTFLLTLVILLHGLYGMAQYTPAEIEFGGFNCALAKDGSDNIYTVRYNGTSYEVKKYTPPYAAANGTTIYSGLSVGSNQLPWGITVTDNGDVFVLNSFFTADGQIIKLNAATSYSATVLHSGKFYSAITKDKNNNLLTLEYNGSTAYEVVKYNAAGGYTTRTVLYSGLLKPAAPVTVPWGIVSDAQDNIYVLDYMENGGGPLGGGNLIKLTAPAYSATTIGTDKSYSSLAIDAFDNVYTVEGLLDPTKAQVVRYTAPVIAGQTGKVLYANLSTASMNYPWGLALTSTKEIFVNEGAHLADPDPSVPAGRMIKLTAPPITVISSLRANPNPSNAASLSYTVKFSDDVNNVTSAAFALNTSGMLTGANIIGVSGSGDTYTVTVNTGTGDGTIRLNTNGNGILPAFNPSIYLGGEIYTIDKTAPTGTLSINSGATHTNNTNVTLATTKTDADATLEMRFSNDNVTFSAWEPFLASKSHTLTAGEGLKTVYMELRDRAGNVSTVISDQITLDQTEPNTAITVNPPTVSNSATATFEFMSPESNCTFETSIDGSAFNPGISPATFTGLTAGSHTFQVRAKDPAGNIDATPAPYTWTVDFTAPVVSSVSVPASAYYRVGNNLDFRVNYSEMVAVVTTGGTPYLEVNVGADVRQAVYIGGSGTSSITFRYTVAAGDTDADGVSLSPSIILNGGTITDVANNAGLLLQNVAPLNNVRVNTSIPSVVLSTLANSIINTTFWVKITFSEAVFGLSASDFTVNNATLNGLNSTDNITYNIEVFPASEGALSISLPAGVTINVGGNNNTASNTLNFQYDGTAPQINTVDMSPAGDYNIGDVFMFTVNYNEVVHVNTTGGTPYLNVILGGSAYRGYYFTGSGSQSITFTYTVVGGELETTRVGLGTNIILNGGNMRDAAGNNAFVTLQNVAWQNIKVYGIRPAVTLSTLATNPVGAPYTLSAVFSEPVTGFTLSDLTVTNANLSNLQTADNITYTMLVTPVADGAIAINLPAGQVASSYQNGNTASNQHTMTYDNTVPYVTFVGVPVSKYYKTGDVLSFTVNYNENVTVTGSPYINLQVGAKAAQAVYQSGSGTNVLTYRYTVVAGDVDEDGVVPGTNVALNSGSIKDAISNDALPALNNMGNTTGVLVYTTIPSANLTSTAGARVNAPFTLTVQFNEAVTGLTISDFAVTNGTASLLQTTDNILYTLLITPLVDGTVNINLPPNVVVNKVGVSNPANNSLSIAYDGTAPVITAVNVPADGYYRENEVLTFTVQTSETIQGSGAPYLEVLIGPAIRQATYVSGLGTNLFTFSYVVQDGDMDMGGIALGINLVGNNAILKDAAGNDLTLTLQNIGNTFSVRVNTRRPTATIATTAAARVNAAYTISITFSEAVTGFALTDLTVTNGLAGNLQTTDNITYTALITPTADGAVTITLPADQALNIGRNGNRASNTLSNIYDATAPVIAAGQAFSVDERSPVGTVAGTVTATEAIGTLQNWTITTDGSGGALAISANGTITVKDQAILNSKANTTVTLFITVSDGLNTSVPTAVAITIKPINKAPFFDPVADRSICNIVTTQTFAVTGGTATEPAQTFAYTISADQPFFDVLTIDGAGLVSYKLKASAVGKANITVVIKDNGGTVNGGVDAFQRTFALQVNSRPVVTISSNKGTTVSKGDLVQLTASGADTYDWGTATGAVFNVRPQANTTYQVTGTNAAGCPATGQISITITADYKVDATNILTPNGDGVNDRWIIRNLDSYPNNELKIFDRTGRVVYQRRNYSNDWDGSMNGRRLPEGTYYYILTIDGSGKTEKGFITLILDQK